MLTFKQARKVHFTDLSSMGWTLSDPNLKVPHATSPCGRYRLWYKPQAVHYTTGAGHNFKYARTLSHTLDMRVRSVEFFLDVLYR